MMNVPDGWKLVPIEPSFEMSKAGKHAIKGSADAFERTQAKNAYAAMLAASPAAPIAEAEQNNVERVAKAMAIHTGWDKWDTATDFTYTPSGNEPEDERDYFRDLARVALTVAAEQSPIET